MASEGGKRDLARDLRRARDQVTNLSSEHLIDLARRCGYEFEKSHRRGEWWWGHRRGAPRLSIPPGRERVSTAAAAVILRILEEVSQSDTS